MLPTLQNQQCLLDSRASNEEGQLPKPTYDPCFTKIASSKTEINNLISAMQNTMGSRQVTGLDCEWKIQFNRRGLGGQDKVALLQLSYIDKNEQMRVLLLILYRLDQLPDQLEALLLDDSIKFVGVNVSGDLRKVARDFMFVERMNRRVTNCNVINLGKYARVRDVVQNGSVGMGRLCKLVLGMSIDKSDLVRFSDWTRAELLEDQIRYAALDAIISLQLFLELEKS